MLNRKAKLVAAVAVTLVALAVGLTVWLTSGSTNRPLTHAGFSHLYVSTTVGKTRIQTVLDEWPKHPYQDFHDGAGNHCFEWFDEAKTLYDLCFNKAGLLVSKQTP